MCWKLDGRQSVCLLVHGMVQWWYMQWLVLWWYMGWLVLWWYMGWLVLWWYMGGWFWDGTWDGSYHWQQKMCFIITNICVHTHTFVTTKVILVAAPANDTFCAGTWMVGSVLVHGWLVLCWYMDGWFCAGTWMVGSVLVHEWLVLCWYMDGWFCAGTWMVGSVLVHGTWDGWFSGGTWDCWFCGGTWDMGWMVLWWYMGHGMDGSVVVQGTWDGWFCGGTGHGWLQGGLFCAAGPADAESHVWCHHYLHWAVPVPTARQSGQTGQGWSLVIRMFLNYVGGECLLACALADTV